jgi:hydroxyacylglutathione hydrolase
MLIERIEDRGLSHYSYVVICEGAGQMAVIDPRRDVDVYLDLARSRDLRIGHVLETHIHADYASGARELAATSGTELWLSAYDAGELYDVHFPHNELLDGGSVTFGSVRLEAMHTPGHTPEHVSFLVYDTARSASVPMTMLSGDFLFVGSLGRPDLLGEEAKLELAKRLYRSVYDKLKDLPDGLEVAPAHGSGSMCGAGMSGRAVSTLGFERIANPYLQPGLSEEQFVRKILDSVPPFPDYYRRMKVLNSQGPSILRGLPGRDVKLSLQEFRAHRDAGAIVIDVRDQLGFGAAHIPASYGIPGGPKLSTWASWVVPYDQPLLLVAPEEGTVHEAIRSLIRVGLDDVRGSLRGGIETWIAAGLPIEQTPQVAPVAIARKLGAGEAVHIVDVRGDGEWASGHVAGARHVMGGHVAACAEQLRQLDGTIAVICGSGYRSTVASSVLQRAGLTNVVNVTGGMNAWRQSGLPTVTS